jgi:REP element-mobilizing transposase RayT
MPQTITFRLHDSLPVSQLRQWALELDGLPLRQGEAERRRLIEEYLDTGVGAAWLSKPAVAEIVEGAFLHFDGQRYRLHAWVVMPNHVHVLVTPADGNTLSGILHSWKSFTAHKANIALGRTEAFWQEDYWDRFIRTQEHYWAAIAYIEHNPVKAGLCETPERWTYSSARLRHLECGRDARAPRVYSRY